MPGVKSPGEKTEVGCRVASPNMVVMPGHGVNAGDESRVASPNMVVMPGDGGSAGDGSRAAPGVGRGAWRGAGRMERSWQAASRRGLKTSARTGWRNELEPKASPGKMDEPGAESTSEAETLPETDGQGL